MIKKFQQGGQQDAIMQFVQGLAETLQADPQQIVQIAQQNPDALKSAVQVYQETQDIQKAAQAFVQATKQQAQRAAHGAKLQYLKTLKNKCEEGEELVYYKAGGAVKCGCMPKKDEGGEIPGKKWDVVGNFKNKIRKKQQETRDRLGKEQDKRNPPPKPVKRTKEEQNKIDKLSEQDALEGKQYKNKYKKGGDVVKKFKAKCGTKMKKHQNGGSLNGVPFIKIQVQ